MCNEIHCKAMRWSPAYHTACQIQKKILEAMGLEFLQANQAPKPVSKNSPNLTPGQLKQLADSWSNLEERKRILRMKPKPRDVEVLPKAKKAPNVGTFSE